jgi:IclR family transcriptional regulator, acetate operon repressor
MHNVLTVLDVLEAVSVQQPVGVSELARSMDLPKSTVQRSLETLHAAGWLQRGASGAWSLTLKPAVVGHRAGNEWSLRDAARPIMVGLRDETGETVRLWLRDGNDAVLIETIESAKTVRAILPIGSRIALHASSAGKAILAALALDELNDYLAGELRAYTERTIVEPAKLRRGLEEIRTRGYAQSYREANVDVGGVAAPLLSPDKRPIAAIGVVLPMHRLDAGLAAHFGELVERAAAQVTVTIGNGA